MGAPVSRPEAATQPAAESLLNAFETLDAAERRKHASVLNYWLSIRGDKDFPPIRDLDPLEISDAAPSSLLLELIGGGEDAEIRHLGEELKPHGGVDRVSEAVRPSLLSVIAAKLGIVAISRNFLAFEDEYTVDGQACRACITLLPFSSTGAWVDFVYGYVTLDAAEAKAIETPAAEPVDAPAMADVDGGSPEAIPLVPDEETAAAPDSIEPAAEAAAEPDIVAPAAEAAAEPETIEPVAEAAPEPETIEPIAEAAREPEPAPNARPGFSKLLDVIAGFHGTNVKAEPKLPAPPPPELAAEEAFDEPIAEEAAVDEPMAEEAIEEPVAEEPLIEAETVQPAAFSEGTLESKLAEVRAKADEAREARLRGEQAFYEGVGAAYDFALDAETSPEEYLRLVEAQGLKIQLRSPMAPVAWLAFDGLCDESTLGDVAKVLAWALKEELPRGSLTGRIQSAGGLAPLLNEARAA